MSAEERAALPVMPCQPGRGRSFAHLLRSLTAEDVKCTWDLLTGRSSQRLRLNPRKSWYHNLEEVTTNGDFEVTFHLHRPQPVSYTHLTLPTKA